MKIGDEIEIEGRRYAIGLHMDHATNFPVLRELPQKSELEKAIDEAIASVQGNGPPKFTYSEARVACKCSINALLEYLDKNAYPPRDDRPDRGEIMGIMDTIKLARKWCGK